MEGFKKKELYDLSASYLTSLENDILEKNEKNGNIMNPTDFISEINPETGPYSMSEVKEDNDKLLKVQNKFDDNDGLKISQLEKARLLASAFEKSMPILVEENNLFGEDVRSILTTEYDDVMNGIDVVVDFPGIKSETLGLAIDLTISEISIDKKIQRIKDNMRKGFLSKIKYFKSKDGRYIGRKNHIVPLVVTGNQETALRLIKNITANNTENLNNDVFQFQALDQIVMQLEKFLDFTNNNEKKFSQTDKEESGISKYIEGDLIKIKEILDKKKDNISETEYSKIVSEYDNSFHILKEKLTKIFSN